MHHYRITADVSTVLIVVGAATRVLEEALRQHDHARLRFKQHRRRSSS